MARTETPHIPQDGPPFGLFQARSHVNWVRLRTLIVLRWIAIAGQIVAIAVARWMFDLDLDLGLAALAIGASVVTNLVAVSVYPESKRLGEAEVAMHLVFDITQVSLLLYLTGGLNNPFAVLVLIPVTVSATALQMRTTVIVGAIAIAMVSFVTLVHLPLRTADGAGIEMPGNILLGFWVAIVLGVIFLAGFAQRVTSEVRAMSDALTATQMALAREQKLTDLGGVVAAAAHELGTPLATIKLASSELLEELQDRPELREDLHLIRDQADRCRDILRSMGRAGKDDLHLRQVPVSALVREAAEPHENRGIVIAYEAEAADASDPRQPVIRRRPEIVHGLRNLIQNAVDFAATAVWIDIRWDDDTIAIRIVDDGPGFPAQVLGRIGDPFMRARRDVTANPDRAGYEGMGLGLFIAKTLLERSGAELAFANARDPHVEAPAPGARNGAVVAVTWPRRATAIAPADNAGGLGENRRIEA